MDLLAWLLVGAVSIAEPAPKDAAANAEWPQWGGPGRDFSLELDSPLKPWIDESPLVLWRRELGPGYSGIASNGTTLFTMTRRGSSEAVLAIAAETGETLWEHAYPAAVEPSPALDTSWGSGPNGTPLLARGRVYSLGFAGRLTCLDAASGRELWAHDLASSHGVASPYFGHSTSPLRYRDLVIVVAGGMLAFDLETGALRWHNDQFEGSYASPTLVDHGGRQLVVAPVAGRVVGIDPEDGRLLWAHEHANDYSTFLSSAVRGEDGWLFASAYFLGSVGLRLGPGGATATQAWSNPKLQLSQSNAVRFGDLVVGSHNSILMAVEMATGEIVWRQRGFKKANLLRVGDQALLLDHSGRLALATVDRDGLAVLAEAQVLDGRSWTAPTLVGRRLFVRNREVLVALDLDRSGKSWVEPRQPRIVAFEAGAHDEFLRVKTATQQAFLRSDAEGLVTAEAAMARWMEDPHLGHLAHYYAGFAAYQRALLEDGDDERALELLQAAERHLATAIERERTFVDAHALLASLLPLYYRYDPGRGAVIGPLGDEHLETALKLAPENPRVVAVRGLDLLNSPAQYGGDPVAGLVTLGSALGLAAAESRAVRLEPDWGRAAIALWYAQGLVDHAPERRREAIAVLETALAEAPDFARARALLEELRSGH